MKLAPPTVSIARNASIDRGIRRCYGSPTLCHKPVNKPMIIVI